MNEARTAAGKCCSRCGAAHRPLPERRLQAVHGTAAGTELRRLMALCPRCRRRMAAAKLGRKTGTGNREQRG